MQTTREPSASLEDIMKLGPISIYFGSQHLGEAVPRQFSSGGYGFALSQHVRFEIREGVTAHCHASLIMIVRPDAAAYSVQTMPQALSA